MPLNDENKTYQCNCPNGCSGDTCATCSDLCQTNNPCLNGGSCMINPQNQLPFCSCTPGYSGIYCQIGMLQLTL